MNFLEDYRKNLRKEDVELFIEEIKDSTVIIMPHEVTDHDAFAASLLLKKILEIYNKGRLKIILYAPQLSIELREFLIGIGYDYRHLGNKLDDVLKEKFNVILVDITAPERFMTEEAKEILSRASKIYAIDHHRVRRDDMMMLLADRTSTTEVVIELGEILGVLEEVLTDRVLVNLLIAGILTDTSMLFYANQKTFETLSKLVVKGDYKLVYSKLKSVKKNFSEKMARLKGVKRANILKIGDKIVAVTKVGSYEASVASALVSLGANIAIVITEKKEKGRRIYRVSARSNGFDVSKIFMELSKIEGFEGGGHPTAAGIIVDANRVKDEKELTRLILKKLIQELQGK